MKTVEKQVKSKGEVVSTIVVPVYDSLAEMVDAVGEAKVLKLANEQLITNLQNEERASKTGKPSNAKLVKQAINNITPEEFAAVAGDPAGIEALIAKKIAELTPVVAPTA
jgi:hypothetical protein